MRHYYQEMGIISEMYLFGARSLSPVIQPTGPTLSGNGNNIFQQYCNIDHMVREYYSTIAIMLNLLLCHCIVYTTFKGTGMADEIRIPFTFF